MKYGTIPSFEKDAKFNSSDISIPILDGREKSVVKTTSTREFRDLTRKDITKGFFNDFTRTDKSALFDQYLALDRTADIDIVAGIPGTLSSFFFHSEFRQLYHRHCLYQMLHEHESKALNLKEQMKAFFEILAKGLIYKELKKDTVIFAHTTLAYYVKSVCVTGRGFQAVWLKRISPVFTEAAKSHSPTNIVGFCGSQFHPSGLDALSSYKNDTQPCIGREALQSGRDWLKQCFDEMNDKQTKAVLCGHSLGGAIAQLAAAEFPEYVSQLILYNSPGVPHEIHDKLDRKVETLRSGSNVESIINTMSLGFKIKIYCTIGDFVFQVGGYHLGKSQKWGLFNPKFYLCEIDKPMYWGHHSYISIANPKKFPITFTKSKSMKTFEFLHNPSLETLRYTFSCTNSLFFTVLRQTWRYFIPSRAESMNVPRTVWSITDDDDDVDEFQ
jgi:hypothetical protein